MREEPQRSFVSRDLTETFPLIAGTPHVSNCAVAVIRDPHCDESSGLNSKGTAMAPTDNHLLSDSRTHSAAAPQSSPKPATKLCVA